MYGIMAVILHLLISLMVQYSASISKNAKRKDHTNEEFYYVIGAIICTHVDIKYTYALIKYKDNLINNYRKSFSHSCCRVKAKGHIRLPYEILDQFPQ